MYTLFSLDGLGTLAAVIMALGYVLYAIFLFQARTRANATAWGLMCVSATTFLIVEYIYGVPWNALKLGFVDAVIAFVIMGLAYLLGRMQSWTQHDKKLIVVYVLLLAIYLTADFFKKTSTIEGHIVMLLQIIIILIYNLITVLEFIPIIKETWSKNENELPWPWIVWTLSYVVYFYVRVLEDVDAVNLVYPFLSIILHGSVAVFTVSHVWMYDIKRTITNSVNRNRTKHQSTKL